MVARLFVVVLLDSTNLPWLFNSNKTTPLFRVYFTPMWLSHSSGAQSVKAFFFFSASGDESTPDCNRRYGQAPGLYAKESRG